MGTVAAPQEKARRWEEIGRRGENTTVERTCTINDTRKGGRQKGGGEAMSREVKSWAMQRRQGDGRGDQRRVDGHQEEDNMGKSERGGHGK
jgi:hypothetical protein